MQKREALLRDYYVALINAGNFNGLLACRKTTHAVDFKLAGAYCTGQHLILSLEFFQISTSKATEPMIHLSSMIYGKFTSQQCSELLDTMQTTTLINIATCSMELVAAPPKQFISKDIDFEQEVIPLNSRKPVVRCIETITRQKNEAKLDLTKDGNNPAKVQDAIQKMLAGKDPNYHYPLPPNRSADATNDSTAASPN